MACKSRIFYVSLVGKVTQTKLYNSFQDYWADSHVVFVVVMFMFQIVLKRVIFPNMRGF